MFDGKTFLPVTGTPMRKMACISRPLADADPVPFGVAILKAKSLVRSMDSSATSFQLPASSWFQRVLRAAARHRRTVSAAALLPQDVGLPRIQREAGSRQLAA